MGKLVDSVDEFISKADWLDESHKPGIELLKWAAAEMEKHPNAATQNSFRLTWQKLLDAPRVQKDSDELDDLIDGG